VFNKLAAKCVVLVLSNIADSVVTVVLFEPVAAKLESVVFHAVI